MEYFETEPLAATFTHPLQRLHRAAIVGLTKLCD